MKTEDLIDTLAAGIEPVRPARLNPLLLAGGAIVAIAAVMILLGSRSDLAEAARGAAFWLKAGYTTALAASALWLTTRLGKPGMPLGAAGWSVLAVACLAGLVGVVELLRLPPEARMDDWLGFTWKVCALNIVMISAFTAPLIFLAARRMAPTRPMVAGASAGLLTGAVAATAYGLHCPEATAAFVATWYTLGVAVAAGCGAVIGRFTLRW